MGDIGVGTFRKLMSSLVESTMLYGAEIWGCNRNLEGVEQTQLRALRMFFGVGTLHPKVSLLAEMGDLPIRWRAKLQCVLFWVRVLSSRVYDGRLIRQVATEAVKFGRGSWLRKMSMCCKEFGWKDVSMEGVRGLSNAETKEMLESIAWRKAREEWGQEMEAKPKLIMLKKITDLEKWADLVCSHLSSEHWGLSLDLSSLASSLTVPAFCGSTSVVPGATAGSTTTPT